MGKPILSQFASEVTLAAFEADRIARLAGAAQATNGVGKYFVARRGVDALQDDLTARIEADLKRLAKRLHRLGDELEAGTGVTATEPPPQNVVDLMNRLKASLAERAR